MRAWAEAALGRRQLGRTLRRLSADGFEVRDVLVDGDSVQHSDRLLVGPQGVFVAAFRGVPGNLWRSERHPAESDTVAAFAYATQRLAEVVTASLQSELTRLGIGVHPVLTIIGSEQETGAMAAGLPLLGPAGLLEHCTTGPQVLSPMQVDALVDRIDDWLARRSVTGLHARAGRRGGSRGRHGSL